MMPRAAECPLCHRTVMLGAEGRFALHLAVKGSPSGAPCSQSGKLAVPRPRVNEAMVETACEELQRQFGGPPGWWTMRRPSVRKVLEATVGGDQ